MQHESLVRLTSFAGIFLALALLESLFPKRSRKFPRLRRWVTNIALIVLSNLVVRLLIPLLAIGVAEFANTKNWGLFNLLDSPPWATVILSIVLLDMLIYWQHVATHHISFLWALHKVHHSDRDVDVTTGIRFHPLEIGLSLLYKFLCIVVLGAPVLAVLTFEILLNASALFSHSNLRMPASLDRFLRRFIVTPDMHRIHHSMEPLETNSNYGFNLSIWDRLFGSYTLDPQVGQKKMAIGLSQYQSDKPIYFTWCLRLPFVGLSRSTEPL